MHNTKTLAECKVPVQSIKLSSTGVRYSLETCNYVCWIFHSVIFGYFRLISVYFSEVAVVKSQY